MNIRIPLSAVLALGIVAGAASPGQAQISAQGGSYLFRMKFVPNAKASYSMNVTSPMAKQPISMSMSTLVKSVAGSTATVQYTINFPAGMMGGNQKPKPQVQDIKIDTRGRLVSPGAAGMGEIGNIQFPEKAIRVGQTWSGSATANGGPGMPPVKLTTTYKFVGLKSEGGFPVAAIAVTMKGGNAQFKTNGTGTVHLRVADGSLQSSRMNSTTTVTMSNNPNSKPMTFNSTMTMTRK